MPRKPGIPPTPEQSKDPFGALCTLCQQPRVPLWTQGWVRVCSTCDRLDLWPAGQGAA